MGIIKKQAIGYTIISYLGVAIGSLSTIFLYPRDKEIYGLFRFLVDSANIIQPFAMLGAWYIAFKLYPSLKTKFGTDEGLWGFISLIFVIGCSITGIFFLFNKNILFPIHEKKDSLIFQRYLWTIYPLLLIIGYFTLSRSYALNLFKATFPSILDQLIKISFPIIFVLYLLKIINLDGLVLGIFVHFIIVTLLSIGYLKKIGMLSYRILPLKKIKSITSIKELIGFAIYGTLGSGSAMLALRIDTLMVGKYLGSLDDVGRFNIASLIGSNIALPLTALTTISVPIIAKAWEDNNRFEIENLYRKSSENLLLIGMYLFGAVILCINDLFEIMPNKSTDYQTEILIVYIVGLKSVIDMATGFNEIIIGYSKSYLFNLILITIMAILNIIGNMIFIPKYGIMGAAISTFLSSLLFNIAKFLFIKFKFGFMPYTVNSIKILLITIVGIWIGMMIPDLHHPIVNIIEKGMYYTLFVGSLALYFDVSADITLVKQQIMKRLGVKNHFK